MDGLPSIIVPDIEQIKTIEIPLPTVDVPYYEPMVVPPSDLRDQEEEPVKTVEEKPIEPPTLKIPFIKQPVPQPSAEVVVAAVTTAVTAVAATTVATPIIQDIRERVTKFINNKIKKWRQNRQKKKESLPSSKKM